MPTSASSGVFISYSHDSDSLDAKVLGLADRLSQAGFDCAFDQYEPHPAVGWPQWMDHQLDEAAFVLVVCSEGYYRKSKADKFSPSGRGVKFESVLLIQDLYDLGMRNERVIPVLFDDLPTDLILRPLRAYARYRLDQPRGYEDLLRHLTGQPHHLRPTVGPRPILPPDRPPLPPPELPLIRNLPDSLGDLFKGRDELLLQLAAEFAASGTARELRLCGLGGIGKTRLAVEYAWRYGARYAALLFARADSPEGLHSQIQSLAGADLLCLPERQAPEAEAMAAVGRWLRENPGWLLILDGADTEEAARTVIDLLPRLLGGHILITSRFTRWPPTVRELSLPLLTPEEAVACLLDHTAGRREAALDDAGQAATLADTLGYLPLALEQAAAFIAANQMSLAAYLDSWARERRGVLEWYDGLVMQYPASVAVTWQKTFRRLGPVAGALLRLTAHLAPEPIPLPMLLAADPLVREAATLLCEETDQSASQQTLSMALADLASYSLVIRRGRELSVHRMVQEVLRARIPEARRYAWVEQSLRLVDNFLPIDPAALRAWPNWDLVRPHALKVLELADLEGMLESTSRLRNRVGLLLQMKGLLSEAEMQFRRGIEIAEATRGYLDRAVAVETSNLASVLKAAGRLHEAETLYREALAIDESCAGAEHLEVATDLNNLALLLKDLGRLDEAAQLLRRASSIFEASLGAEHPSTRTVRANLKELVDEPSYGLDFGTSRTVLAGPDVAPSPAAPTGDGEELIVDFSLKIQSRSGGGHAEYAVFVLDSPAGIAQGVLRLPPLEDPDQSLADVGQSLSGAAGALAEDQRADSPRSIGDRLFRALFTGPVRSLYDTSLGWALASPGRSLRLSLHFDASEPDLALLSSLPWELLYWQERREYLSLGRRTPLVRTLDVPRPLRPFAVDLPLRVLIISAEPEGLAPLKIEQEYREICEALGMQPDIEITNLPHITAETLRRKLLGAPFHVLHFIGHGKFSSGTGVGELLIEDPSGHVNAVPGSALAELLRGFEALRLVVLSTCGGARVHRREGVDPFASVATALVMAGIPAVISMQFVISDADAIAFSAAFYRSLVAGDPVETAATQGRLAIFLRDSASIAWAAPVVFLRSPSGKLLDLSAPRPDRRVVPEDIRRHIVDFSLFIAEKSTGFIGRSWLFEDIDRFLETQSRGYVLLHGAPGVGQTAFMAELSKRLGCVHHFNIRAAGICRPDQFLDNVCAQLITRYHLEYPALPPEARQDSRFLEMLLARVSTQLPQGEKAVILVHALDEADPDPVAPEANALHLPTTLPKSVYFVVSARRGSLPLRIDGDQPMLKIAIEQDSPDNMADARAFVASRVHSPAIGAFLAARGLDREAFIAGLTARSEGNFLYLHHLLSEIDGGTYSDTSLYLQSRGLNNFYEALWQQMRSRNESRWLTDHLPILVVLTALSEPASVDLLSSFSGILERSRIQAVLRDCESLISISEVELPHGFRERRYRLYHSSFRDFIAQKSDVVGENIDLAAAHQRIARTLWKELESGK